MKEQRTPRESSIAIVLILLISTLIAERATATSLSHRGELGVTNVGDIET